MSLTKPLVKILQAGLTKSIKIDLANPDLVRTSLISALLPEMSRSSTFFNGTEDDEQITVCAPFSTMLTVQTDATTEAFGPEPAEGIKPSFTLKAIGDLVHVQSQDLTRTIFVVTECLEMRQSDPDQA